MTASGAPGEVFEPRHTTHGFQYVSVHGLAADLAAEDITACLVQTDLEPLGVLPLMVADEAEYVVGELPNGRLVAAGGADLRPVAEAGLLWQLSVHPLLQGLGIGTALVAELDRPAIDVSMRSAHLLGQLWDLLAGSPGHEAAKPQLREAVRAYVDRRIVGAEDPERQAGFLAVPSVARLVALLDAS